MTHDLRLIPIDAALLDSLQRGDGTFEHHYQCDLGAHAAEVFRDAQATLAMNGIAFGAPWAGGWLAADDALGAVVGICGCNPAPRRRGDLHTVEIAYGTFEPFQGKGYATAMAIALTRLVLEHAEITRVIAHTLPQRNASCRVLEKAGFALQGEVIEPEDGLVWRWVYRGAARAAGAGGL